MATRNQSQPHPTAQALFTHFDQVNLSTDINNQNNKNNKIKTTAGWRNRYSTSSPFYYLTLSKRNNSNKRIEIIQQTNIKETGTCVWPASIILIKFLEYQLQEKTFIDASPKSIVELGAGSGIVSIAASYYYDTFILCTDNVDSVLDIAQKNVKRNSSIILDNDESINIQLQNYSWGDESTSQSILNTISKHVPSVDIILISDCILPKLFPIEPLVQSIKQLSSITTKTYISYEQREFLDYNPKERFFDLADKYGMICNVIDRVEYHPMYFADDIELWEVYMK